jgi:hypothetical protein
VYANISLRELPLRKISKYVNMFEIVNFEIPSSSFEDSDHRPNTVLYVSAVYVDRRPLHVSPRRT